jgi:DNA polymerase III sliding clamp (beta) subunit (PCNA family)
MAHKLPAAEALLASAVVPAKEFARALKALPRPGRDGRERQAGVLLTSPEVLISSGETIFAARPVEGRFPDYAGVLPKTPAPVAFRVNSQLLIDLLKAAAVACPVK